MLTLVLLSDNEDTFALTAVSCCILGRQEDQEMIVY